jgi:translation initiation factor IF-2
MKKIRINELARELEVKPNVILDMLPELGVEEKKTHSSSIDEDVALVIRKRLGFDVPSGNGAPPPAEPEGAAERRATQSATAVEEPPVAPEHDETAVTAGPVPEAPAAATPVASEENPAAVRAPLRPPLATGPRAPLTPPLRGAQSPPAMPLRPPQPAAPRTPEARPSAPAIPAAPGPPPPKPGQILTGPRVPLPVDVPRPTVIHPGTPQPAAAPGTPRPAAPAMPMPPRPRVQSPGPGPSQPMPAAPRPAARQNLVGQPAARPIVPPNPAVLERLRQTQPKAMPGQPSPPPARPGIPQRPSGLVPGRPIYPGPVRPGGPPGRFAPGPTRPPMPGMRGRGMHPTALPPPPPAPTTDRRHKTKAAPAREREIEEGKLKLGPRRQETFQLPQIDREITISEGITVKELAEKLGVKVNLVVKRLMDKKVFATINQALDTKLAEEVARAFGASINKVTYEEEAIHDIESTEVETDRVKRPPVVTIMGHVDHGKTSLLDAIRATDVAGGEAGGITQHIGAYQITKDGRRITFIDTPGHEAFTRMRARGAKVTDVVVLVVAADDGVMPQTLEAIDHAKAAKVPIVVAINKVDRPDAQPERIKQQLADRNLLAEDWGGDTVMVPVSAKQKLNLDLLLEMILLVSDIADLKANPERPAVGNVLEAQLDRGRGPVATVLVRNGTLHNGDFFICGSVFGKVRALFNDRGEQVKEADPSMPVEVLGLDSLPEVGDTFQVVTDTAKAKQIVMYREGKEREAAMAKTARMTLDKLHQHLREGEVKELNIIIKADVGGSAEVIADTLQKLSNEKVRIRVLRAGVGAVTEGDVLLATTSDAIIIGFNVRPERGAQNLAEQENVDIRLHTIIYDLTDEIKRAMTGMLEPVTKEVYRGRAEVRETFRITKVGTIAGCAVQDGTITRDSQIRLLRDNVVVHTGRIESLKRFKNDVSEVKSGFECGISIAGYNDVKPGDVIEAFVIERIAPEATA